MVPRFEEAHGSTLIKVSKSHYSMYSNYYYSMYSNYLIIQNTVPNVVTHTIKYYLEITILII